VVLKKWPIVEVKINCILLLVVGLSSSGCALFSTKPALPRQVAADSAVEHTDEFTLSVQRADIIYFPVEAIGAGSTEQSVAKIFRTLKSSRTPFVIAWEGIESSQQLTQDLPGEVADEPRWNYTGRLREQCKAVLRETLEVRQLFLGCPRAIVVKLQAGSVLNSDEKKIIPRGYRAPAGGLEDFAEQLAAVRGLQERDIANLYRAHVIAEQFAAEKIVSFMHEHSGGKLLVFARRRDLNGGSSLPAFVAQKLQVRQISFDPGHSRNARPRLVGRSRTRCGLSWLEIVNRSPASTGDTWRALFPRMRARAVVRFFFSPPK
jgi:hypothetical protein